MMKAIKISVLVLVLSLGTSLAFADGVNLVTNGGFETGPPFSGWTQGGDIAYTTVGTSNCDGAGYCAKLGPSGFFGTLSQTLATTPGAIRMACSKTHLRDCLLGTARVVWPVFPRPTARAARLGRSRHRLGKVPLVTSAGGSAECFRPRRQSRSASRTRRRTPPTTRSTGPPTRPSPGRRSDAPRSTSASRSLLVPPRSAKHAPSHRKMVRRSRTYLVSCRRRSPVSPTARDIR